MIIIRFHGGIGNQMFQYSLYVALVEAGRKVRIDTSENSEYLSSINQSDIFSIFGIDYECLQADSDEIARLKVIKRDLISKIRKKLFGYRGTWYFEKKEGCYDSNIANISDVYLDGYWQSEKYFAKYRSRILDTYRFNLDISKECRDMLNMIENCTCAVSVHVRQGDYLNAVNRELYGNICTEAYYKSALDYFVNKYPECSFFFFSDDKEHIKKYEEQDNCYIVNCSDGYNAWIDMMLMSRCRHNIIANSSFSWWGAWLNTHEDKEVIAPAKWINGKEMPDVCPESWLRI